MYVDSMYNVHRTYIEYMNTYIESCTVRELECETRKKQRNGLCSHKMERSLGDLLAIV